MERLVRRQRADEGVVVLTLDRPEQRNALSIALRDELSDILDALADDPRTKVIVLTGAGATFCAGFDLKEFELPDRVEELWSSSDRFHHRFLRFPLPILAAVNGPALAGGFDLAVMCDLRVASTEARFAHPEASWGDVVYSPLHELVGGAIARELAFTGRSIDAAEAYRLHLVTSVVAPDRLLTTALEMAATIAKTPRETLVRTKGKAIRRSVLTLGATLDL